jgi:hypothetical protein
MKIGFLAPINGFKDYGTIYKAIVKFLIKNGHDVIHPLEFNLSMLNSWSKKERITFFEEYYEKVNNSDLIVAECSYSCVSMGFELAKAIKKGKEVIVLKTKESNKIAKKFTPLYQQKNIHTFEYDSFNVNEILGEALAYNHNFEHRHINRLFTPEMIAKHDRLTGKNSR